MLNSITLLQQLTVNFSRSQWWPIIWGTVVTLLKTFIGLSYLSFYLVKLLFSLSEYYQPSLVVYVSGSDATPSLFPVDWFILIFTLFCQHIVHVAIWFTSVWRKAGTVCWQKGKEWITATQWAGINQMCRGEDLWRYLKMFG